MKRLQSICSGQIDNPPEGHPGTVQPAGSEPAASSGQPFAETAAEGAETGRGGTQPIHLRDLVAVLVPVADLRPAPDNARRHSLDRDIPALMASLDRFGQRKPIVAKREYRGLPNVIIAGCGTLTAARRLGWSHIAVAWFDGSDDDARAYAISDNRTAELSAWDAGQLVALQAEGLDLLALWHDDNDLGALLADAAPVPAFEESTDDEQPRLDQLAPIVCPHCGGEISRRDLR
jgi:hypothetical protein